MWKRLGWLAALLTVVALALPAAAPAQGGGRGQGGTTLRLIATETEFQFLDLGPAGIGPGDQFVFADRLSSNGRVVGDDGGHCAITTVEGYNAFTAHCVATLRLRGGQITLQGLVPFSETDMGPFTVAITGGTGAYRGASGEMVVRSLSSTRQLYIVRLDRHRR